MLNDMKPKVNLSTHSQFDDPRWWIYVRDSKIPHGTFDNRINMDAVVVGGVIICLAVGMLAVWIGELLP